jgi:hypothetical protein
MINSSSFLFQRIWEQHLSDPFVTEAVREIFKTMAETPECLLQLQEHLVPHIASIFQLAADHKPGTVTVSTALRWTDSCICRCCVFSECVPEGFRPGRRHTYARESLCTSVVVSIRRVVFICSSRSRFSISLSTLMSRWHFHRFTFNRY